jgi:ABC-type polysaccharide/polyol phosphate export systems, permease component
MVKMEGVVTEMSRPIEPALPARGTKMLAVVREIIEGLADVRMWSYLGWAENKRRYRRTVLGPFWVTASQAVFVLAIGFLYAGLWKQTVSNYLPYLTTGIISWALIATLFNESSTLFSGASNLLTQMRFNLATLAVAMIWRNIIVFLHSFLVYIVVAILFGVPINANTLLVVPGLFLLCLNALWIAMLVGMVGVRYRDLQQLFQNIIQISMFITPVFWAVDSLGERARTIVTLNPFFHLLSVVRDPLLGVAPSLTSFVVCAGLAVLGLAIAVAALARYRHRIVFWI